MNEFGIVDLNVVAQKAIETGDKPLLEAALACSLSSLKLIESVLETKRYELLFLLRDSLRTFFQSATKEQANNLYLDLLLAREREQCAYIKTHCSLDVSQLMLRALERNVDICALDPELCAKYPTNYFYSLRLHDCLSFFVNNKEFLLKHNGRERLYDRLSEDGALQILAHEAAHGEHEQVVKSLLSYGNIYRDAVPALLHSICAEHDCGQVLTKAFSRREDPDVLRLIVRLGAKLSAKQKETLRAQNPHLYAELFAEDV